MIKGVFKNITAIFLALLVMASTMSFTINEHYCGGSLVDTSFFVKAKTCMMEGMDMSSNTADVSIADACCNDVVTIIDGQDEVHQNGKQLTFQQQLFVSSFVLTYSALFTNTEPNVIFYKNYVPPLIVKDIQVLDETFLI